MGELYHLNVWRVQYYKRWRLSRDPSNPAEHYGCKGIVLTGGTDLKDVSIAIKQSLTSEESLVAIEEAVWIGQSIN